jgi:flagellar biosynthetic protein FliQ
MAGIYWFGPWHLVLRGFEMSIDEAILLGQQSITTVLAVGGPPLMAALVVGLMISIFQAVTQINEMTMVFVPKIVAVFVVLLALGGWMMETAISFGTMMFQSISNPIQ